MRTRALAATLTVAVATLLYGLHLSAQRAPAAPQLPGRQGSDVTLLPNGWRIAPVGFNLQVGDFPLSMVESPDGRYVVISNNGWSKPTLTVVDTRQGYVKAVVPVDHAWLGLAWHPDGARLYSSGAAENTINEFKWDQQSLKAAGQFVLGRPALQPTWDDISAAGFIGGLTVSADGTSIFAVHVLGKALSAVDLQHQRVRQTISLPAEPYTALLTADGRKLFVSLWGGARILELDPLSLAVTGEIAVGEHPNAMVLSRDGSRLFVACANTNKVYAVDPATRTVKEQIHVALFPQAPPGTTPNSLSLSPDGRSLAVANADNNTVAMIDVSTRDESKVSGFIPVGWYPTHVTFARDGKRLFVLNGKGLTGQANPRGPQAVSGGAVGQYQGQLLQGALSIIDLPDAGVLKAYTQRAYALSAYDDAIRLSPRDAPKASAIPARVGDVSPIKHVFYVIRENRTYDQILGDIGKGNSDATLALFGEDVTPNAHAIAREFVLLDNFYVDAEVSYDGHAFSTGAYATDVVEKIWPTNYGRRGGVYLSEGGWGDRNPYGNLATPTDGYIWDFALRANKTVRSYGEFTTRSSPRAAAEATVPGLKGKVSPNYAPFDLDTPDNARIDVWLQEFREFEKNGQLPALNIIRLGNDHTFGTRPGKLTPRAMVAENDRALGRLLEAITQSTYWKDSALFVLEDDAQNGPDHVDSHRSVALVASPFIKKGSVDSTLYTTSGVLRTMELILGLPPMSQYDAAATPMYNAFGTTPVLASYTAKPARISLTEVNGGDAWGAQASMAMNLKDADMAPEYELNEILWKSVHGAHSVMPAPVRSGFIRSIEAAGEDEREAAESWIGRIGEWMQSALHR